MSTSTQAMEQLYAQLILDHARAPHGRGLADAPLPGPGTDWAESHQVNPTCGDEITLRVQLAAAPDGTSPSSSSVVSGVMWDGQGCSISQASASVLTELVSGLTVDEAESLGEDFRALMRARGEGLDEAAEDRLGDATAFTGVARYPARIKCALLGWAALRDALAKAGAGAREDES